jgi:hypothetical protein
MSWHIQLKLLKRKSYSLRDSASFHPAKSYMIDLLEDQNMLQLLIDCTQFDFIPLKERSYLETLFRGLCYKLYLQRLHNGVPLSLIPNLSLKYPYLV